MRGKQKGEDGVPRSSASQSVQRRTVTRQEVEDGDHTVSKESAEVLRRGNKSTSPEHVELLLGRIELER